ncbi:MAG: ARMT1-like domain-containing protein [candidate division WOR-3 bacterium]|jgi:damage-control phosphatase, subfamily I
MKTYLECISCFFKQALEAARMAGADNQTQKRILDEVARAIPDIKLSSTPPEMGKTIHDIVKQITGQADPYKELKEKATEQTLKIYPELRKKVESSNDKLLMAVELAIAGNIIDYGTKNSLDVKKELAKILQKEQSVIEDEKGSIFDFKSFKKALTDAKSILYIGDNVGETVFDSILLEQIKKTDKHKEILYAVREKPIINDALKEDAVEAGIDNFAEIISSGSEVPGTIIPLCSKPFIDIFKKSDMTISKGQGNYETLSDETRPIFFLFMAKCPVIARDVDCKVGEIILVDNHN